MPHIKRRGNGIEPNTAGSQPKWKKAPNSSLIFVSLTKFCTVCADSVENRSNKRETYEKKKKMKRLVWLRDVLMKGWSESSRDGNISVYRSRWMGSIWEDVRRVITESLPLARSVMVRSLALEVVAVIVKDLFVAAVSWLLNASPCLSIHVGARRIIPLINIFAPY